MNNSLFSCLLSGVAAAVAVTAAGPSQAMTVPASSYTPVQPSFTQCVADSFSTVRNACSAAIEIEIPMPVDVHADAYVAQIDGVGTKTMVRTISVDTLNHLYYISEVLHFPSATTVSPVATSHGMPIAGANWVLYHDVLLAPNERITSAYYDVWSQAFSDGPEEYSNPAQDIMVGE
jgi:hypothetical protein